MIHELARAVCWVVGHREQFLTPTHNRHCARCDACPCDGPYGGLWWGRRPGALITPAALVVALALSTAAPASAQTPLRDFLYHASQGAAIAAHGADGFSTEYALAKGAFHETNPALLRLTNSPAWFGAVDMSVAAASLWLTSKIQNRTIATIANAGTAGFFAAVAVHNTRAVQGRR